MFKQSRSPEGNILEEDPGMLMVQVRMLQSSWTKEREEIGFNLTRIGCRLHGEALGDNITLSGNVSDFDGDGLNYGWYEGGSELYTSFIGTTVDGTPVTLPDYVLIGGLPLGNHVITLEANDGTNPPVSVNITVDVIDTTAPTIQATVDSGILWPPNHKMVDVVIQVTATDNSDSVTLSATVSSSEPPDTNGDGNTIPDYTTPVIDQITGEITLQLKAERKGKGAGKTYTITVTATDDSGNSSDAIVEVVAPHDKGKK